MRVQVLTDFVDKYTKEYYKTGDILEITSERYSDILKTDVFVKPVIEEEKLETVEDFTKFNLKDLKSFAKTNNIDLEKATKKEDIIEKIKKGLS